MVKRLRRIAGPSPPLLLLKRFCTSLARGVGGVGAHAGAGHGGVKRGWAGRAVVAVAVSAAGTTATAAATGTAAAPVLSVGPSEKWETQGRR